MRYRSRKYLSCIAIFLFVFCYVSSSILFAYIRDVLCASELFQYLSEFLINDDISCYWKKVNRFSVNNFTTNSIFFHQMKCDAMLSLRDACSVEAAAGFHPNSTVYILFPGPVPQSTLVLRELLKLPNVKISRININTYAQATPLSGFLQNSLGNGKVSFKKAVIMVKFLTLFKFGGTILDFDVVVANKLDGLGDNWVVKNNDLSTAILKLSNNVLGHAAAGMALSNIKNIHDDASGDKALTTAFEEICGSSSIENITSKNCNGYKIYEDKLFFPISYSNRYKYFRAGNIDGEVRTYRIWNNEYRYILPGDSLYAKIARSYCPKIFNSFMYEFTNVY